MILMLSEFLGEFLIPMVARVRIDFDRDLLSGASIALTPVRTIANAAEDAIRHRNHPLSYCAPRRYGYADGESESLGRLGYFDWPCMRSWVR